MGINLKKMYEMYTKSIRKAHKVLKNDEKPLFEYSFGNGAIDVKIYYKEGDFTNSRVEIRGYDGIFTMSIDARLPAYAYLLAAAGQERADYIEGFGTLMYQTLSCITQDKGFADDLQRALGKYFKRTMKRAEKAAESVTDAEEMGSQALMEEAVERGEARAKGKRSARRAQKQSRQEMKEILREDKIITNETEGDNGQRGREGDKVEGSGRD